MMRYARLRLPNDTLQLRGRDRFSIEEASQLAVDSLDHQAGKRKQANGDRPPGRNQWFNLRVKLVDRAADQPCRVNMSAISPPPHAIRPAACDNWM